MPGKQKVKYIQSLGQKKHRDEAGLFIAEGPKTVAELLASAPGQVREIYAVKDWLNANTVPATVPVCEEVGEEVLDRLSQLTNSHQVVAVVQQSRQAEPPVTAGSLSLVLDTIQDPGNLGTIIRIADWFGLNQVICSSDSADVYNPKVVQASMGSIARVNVFYTELAPWLNREQAIRKYATSLEGKDIRKMSPVTEGLVIIGNESRGIHPDIANLANEKITIPRIGSAESLNAAVAAGIILYQLAGRS